MSPPLGGVATVVTVKMPGCSRMRLRMVLLNAQLWYWLHWPVSSMTRIFGSAAWVVAVSRTTIDKAAVSNPTSANRVFIVFRQVANFNDPLIPSLLGPVCERNSQSHWLVCFESSRKSLPLGQA